MLFGSIYFYCACTVCQNNLYTPLCFWNQKLHAQSVLVHLTALHLLRPALPSSFLFLRSQQYLWDSPLFLVDLANFSLSLSLSLTHTHIHMHTHTQTHKHTCMYATPPPPFPPTHTEAQNLSLFLSRAKAANAGGSMCYIFNTSVIKNPRVNISLHSRTFLLVELSIILSELDSVQLANAATA